MELVSIIVDIYSSYSELGATKIAENSSQNSVNVLKEV